MDVSEAQHVLDHYRLGRVCSVRPWTMGVYLIETSREMTLAVAVFLEMPHPELWKRGEVVLRKIRASCPQSRQVLRHNRHGELRVESSFVHLKHRFFIVYWISGSDQLALAA